MNMFRQILYRHFNVQTNFVCSFIHRAIFLNERTNIHNFSSRPNKVEKSLFLITVQLDNNLNLGLNST